MPIKDHQRFHALCGGVQAIALTLGLVIGGGWTIYLYDALHESERALADLSHQRMVQEREVAELQRAFGHIELSATPLARASPSDCYLQVIATVANAGTREIRIAMGDSSPMRAAAVSEAADGSLAFHPAATAVAKTFTKSGRSVRTLPGSRLLPGERAEYPFLFRLAGDALYLLQFSVPVDTVSRTRPEPDRAAGGWYWTARKFVRGCESAPAVVPGPASVASFR